MQPFELTPQYDTRKSFYNKAKIIKENGIIKLQSYDTIVCEYNPVKKQLTVNGWFSSTTARHINEFICQWAPFFSRMSKKEMLQKPVKQL